MPLPSTYNVLISPGLGLLEYKYLPCDLTIGCTTLVASITTATYMYVGTTPNKVWYLGQDGIQ